MTTALESMMLVDIRRRRAEAVAAAVLDVVEKYLRDDVRLSYVHRDLLELLMKNGVEVLTDHDRQTHGLPPRGPDGWTEAEILALERNRLEALRRPPQMVVSTKS